MPNTNTMFAIQIVALDHTQTPAILAWLFVAPNGGAPYTFDDRESAERTLRMCYPEITREHRRIVDAPTIEGSAPEWRVYRGALTVGEIFQRSANEHTEGSPAGYYYRHEIVGGRWSGWRYATSYAAAETAVLRDHRTSDDTPRKDPAL